MSSSSGANASCTTTITYKCMTVQPKQKNIGAANHPACVRERALATPRRRLSAKRACVRKIFASHHDDYSCYNRALGRRAAYATPPTAAVTAAVSGVEYCCASPMTAAGTTQVRT